jgi:hypothetical protein
MMTEIKVSSFSKMFVILIYLYAFSKKYIFSFLSSIKFFRGVVGYEVWLRMQYTYKLIFIKMISSKWLSFPPCHISCISIYFYSFLPKCLTQYFLNVFLSILSLFSTFNEISNCIKISNWILLICRKTISVCISFW